MLNCHEMLCVSNPRIVSVTIANWAYVHLKTWMYLWLHTYSWIESSNITCCTCVCNIHVMRTSTPHAFLLSFPTSFRLFWRRPNMRGASWWQQSRLEKGFELQPPCGLGQGDVAPQTIAKLVQVTPIIMIWSLFTTPKNMVHFIVITSFNEVVHGVL